MNQKNIIPVILSSVAGALAALAVSTFFLCRPAQSARQNGGRIIIANQTPATARPTPPEAIKKAENLTEADVVSLKIDTSYEKYFSENSECRRKTDDPSNVPNIARRTSACSVNVVFNRDGSAEKTPEIKHYDKGARYAFVLETRAWKGKISADEFRKLAETIVHNTAFKNRDDKVMINTRNTKITVRHKNGVKEPMSNVDEKATAFLPMLVAFQNLDAAIDWEKVR